MKTCKGKWSVHQQSIVKKNRPKEKCCKLEARVLLDRLFAIFKFEKLVLSLDIKKGKKMKKMAQNWSILKKKLKLQQNFYNRFQ